MYGSLYGHTGVSVNGEEDKTQKNTLIFKASSLIISVFYSGAIDGIRTRDPQLGKLMLYQLSYYRNWFKA